MVFNKPCSIDKWSQTLIPNFFYYLNKYNNWKIAYRNATVKDRALLLKIPNFNKKIWLELTGIDLDNSETWLFDDHIGIKNMMEMFN
jgi:hypothetical protein